MKLLSKLKKEKILSICILTFLFSLLLIKTTLATDFELEVTKEYIDWQKLSDEEKNNTNMPQTFSFDIPDIILNKYESNKVPNLVGSLTKKNNMNLRNVLASSTDSKFNLAEKLDMRVENQGITNECWAFSLIKSMETNIALKEGVRELRNFSERHMDYSLIKTFNDGINKNALNREAGNGGLPIMGLAYLTNGQGAVLEEDMPFENNMDKISLNDINKENDTIATDYAVLPGIIKKYTKDEKGNTINVKYFDTDGNVYSNEQVSSIRKIIKEHLIENGAITSFTAGSKAQFYNNSESIFNATAYNCNDTSIVRDHGITIVGWDDNYSKNNFKEGTKPSTDGAYIVLNSYGSNSFGNGYLYISYEDFFIESELYGIVSTSSVDYDNLYQHDYFGGILKITTNQENKGYYASIFDRDPSKNETLNSVGVSVCDYTNVEIFVNPNGNSLDTQNLIEVGRTTTMLEPGYHRINILPTILNGNEFAVVIKQIPVEDQKFSFQIEANVPNSAYSMVTSEQKSYISVDGKKWINLSSLNVSGVDMSKADVCIKGFTTENEETNNPNVDKISSRIYKIDDEYILNITHNTTKEKLLSNIKTSLDQSIFDENGNEILNNNEIIKTGMKLKLSDNSEYILIIRGDTNCDGKLNLVDLSKLLLHYNEMRDFNLTGVAEKAGDMNFDGIINLVDLSQIIVLYNSI